MSDPFERLSFLLSQIEITPADPAQVAHRPFFICGAPRSGTTLLYQVVSYAGDIGYIDNVAARFAACPPAGIALSKALALEPIFTGKSQYGLTENPTEPHEFGRFWLDAFGLDNLFEPESVSGKQARKGAAAIATLLQEFGSDTLFKSFAYLWFIPQLTQIFPHSCWIFIKRDEEANGASLAELYRSRSEPQWTSAVRAHTRAEASELSLAKRAAAQCRDINSMIEGHLAQISPDRQHQLSIEDLITDPAKQLARLGEKLNIEIDTTRSKKVARTLVEGAK